MQLEHLMAGKKGRSDVADKKKKDKSYHFAREQIKFDKFFVVIAKRRQEQL